MNWLETIDLRSAGNGLKDLKQKLLRFVAEADRRNGLQRINLYHNLLIETDISVHLQWEVEQRAPEKSDLGLHLVSALEEFGRVNHSIWLRD